MGKLYRLPSPIQPGIADETIPAPVVPAPPENIYPRPRPTVNPGSGGGGSGGDSGSGGGSKRLVCVRSSGSLDMGTGEGTRCFWVNN